ncbi:LppX_LprAFG lipoprotein [Mycolicibacterium pulveris]|nr:LppX_LprAFG lipoprotein [Mycolicibacterium pulveris]MCV6982367.1 LppX_LprAFG lipoprotein [Mycolicibacterium pulveris]
MQTRPVAIVAALIAVLALIAGCSKSAESGKDLPDAATLLTQSTETTKNETSVHMRLTVQGEIPGLALESIEGDLTSVPAVAAAGSADLLFMGQRLQGIEFVVVDGILYAAMSAGAFQDFGPAADVYDVSAILNPEIGLANVLANFSDAKAEDRETVNGVETVRVAGTVSAEAVNKIAPQIGATEAVPATAWIAEAGDHALMQITLQTAPEGSITMTFSDWGKPVTVTKPAI